LWPGPVPDYAISTGGRRRRDVVGARTMDAERIFHEAAEIAEPEKRGAYLDEACHGDDRLRAQVEALLSADEQAGSFLEGPAAQARMTLDNPARIDGPGTAIGRYELLELIGEGGMGLVYLAEQKEPVRRKVALKIIKPGMDSRQVVARFEAERQALALLDHPNIAHVFDAGTTETGRPYFVMEFVKGLSITRYCDDNKLTIEQRLRLFEQVCEAVHHAHQKGIIHRDLKPSNILVSVHGDRAVPKIIDFGIAKAITQPLTDKTFVTFQGQLLGTPEYMSPEQVDLATQDIDTRSDIYSLGVVLYELLAGVLPFESDAFERAGLAEIQQTIREQEPASPSIRLTSLGEKAKTIAASRGTQVVPLARRLHRELEWIPLKAMRKDRCRRYRSASEMADDLRNYLTGLPLLAGPETTIYRVQKFVHKHAGSVATVALVAVAIILGLIVSTAMYFRAEEARRKETVARTRAEQAEEATKQKAEELRHTLYANTIQLAEASHREGNASHMAGLLTACPNDLRSWEWYRMNHLQDQSRKTLRGHDGPIHSVGVNATGKYIVSGGADKTIRVWDPTTGAELATLRGHTDQVLCVAISPSGKRIASASADGTIKIWDAQNYAEVMTLSGHQLAVSCIAWSPDEKKLTSGSLDKTIRVWDVTTGREIMTLRGHEGEVRAVAFSTDGRQILSGATDEKTIRVWDAASGAAISSLGEVEPITIGPYQYRSISSIACSSDGQRIVSAGYERVIRIWDRSTGTAQTNLRGHESWISSAAFSPDGQRVVSGGGDNTIRVWDTCTGAELATLRGHVSAVYSVAFNPDGRQIISGSADGTIKIWSTTVLGEPTLLKGHRSAVTSTVFSPDGRHLASTSWDNTIKIWDLAAGVEVMTLRGHGAWTAGAAYSPDGRYIASGGGQPTVWDAATGAQVRTLQGHMSGGTLSVVFLPDGKRMASCGTDGKLRIWDLTHGNEMMSLQAEGEFGCCAVSPSGRRIVASSVDGKIKVWDADTGGELMTLNGHRYGTFSVTYSPDGRYIVSGGSDGDRHITIWDAETGAQVRTLDGHDSGVWSLAISPDGRRIVSGGRDRMVKIWDATNGIEVMSLHGNDYWNQPGYSVSFSPDGRTIAMGKMDGTVQLLESGDPVFGYGAREDGQTAQQQVDEMRAQVGSYQEVIDRLQTENSLPLAVHRLALQIANSRKWEDGEDLRIACWEVVVLSTRDAEAYHQALEKAKQASRLDPNDPLVLTTLGAARYRVGAYEDALAALNGADKLRAQGGDASDIENTVFVAMASHQLGRSEAAKGSLEQARALSKDRRLAESQKALLTEAEGLIEGKKAEEGRDK
jgi:WD40 repeat protein/serine/threonine protein kinase